MKKVFSISTFLVFVFCAFSQAPAWQWGRKNKRPNGGCDVVANGVATDVWGNSIATGYFYNGTVVFDINNSLNNGSSPSMFIVKYDPSGNVLWATTTPGQIQINAITTDALGNIYVTGWAVATWPLAQG